ncbi:MAG: threonine ammonia-lyase [Micrococcaceae bacterium]
MTISFDAILKNAKKLQGIVIKTPLIYSRALSDRAGTETYLKCENLQRAGSFKIRGAYTRISKLSDKEKSQGVVAASAGNHAQGVALAAQMLGIKATIYMPDAASIPKVIATEGYGAEVRFYGKTVDEALEEARRFSDETGAVLIHPFDHEDIVMGQASCGLEILKSLPDVDTIIVGVGGGGLLAGIALVAHEHFLKTGHKIKLIGVQAKEAAAYPESLKKHEIIKLKKMSTMADGIAIAQPGKVPFHIIEQYVDEFVTVSEEYLAQAIVFLAERCKVVAEPAGAATVAAILEKKIKPQGKTVAVLSGGNIDPTLLSRVITHGLAESGRHLYFGVVIKDNPGSLSALTKDIADLGASVEDISHRRNHRLGMEVGQVEIDFKVETRGDKHNEEILAQLEKLGYQLVSSEIL